MNNETMQLLYNRKSVRAYEKQPIPEADVQAILRADDEAPTAGNMTLWSAIRDRRGEEEAPFRNLRQSAVYRGSAAGARVLRGLQALV